MQTWHALFGPETGRRAGHSADLGDHPGGRRRLTKLTVVHDVTGAPLTATMISGQDEQAGGGWAWILSDLKTLLETGSSLES